MEFLEENRQVTTLKLRVERQSSELLPRKGLRKFARQNTPSFKAISGEIFSNLPQKIGIATMISENMKPANIERRKKHLELVFDRYGLKLESHAQLATDWIMTGRLGTKKTLAQVLLSVNHL